MASKLKPTQICAYCRGAGYCEVSIGLAHDLGIPQKWKCDHCNGTGKAKGEKGRRK